MVRPLDDELRWQILHAPADESAGKLAKRLGTSYPATAAFRRKARRHGWTCPLVAIICQRCGGAWLTSIRGKTARLCRTCRVATAPSPRKRMDLAIARERSRDRARRQYRTLAEASVGHDIRRGQPWAEEDRAFLLAHRHELGTPAGVARITCHLGRSYSACRNMLEMLDREAPEE